MRKQHGNSYNILVVIVDYLVISVLFYFFLFFRYDYLYKEKTLETLLQMFEDQYKAYILLLVSWYLISQLSQLYKDFRFSRYISFIRRALYQILLFSLILYTISGIKVESLFTNKQSFWFLGILGIYLLLSRTTIFYTIKQYRKKGHSQRNIIMIGESNDSNSLINFIKLRNDYGLNIKKSFVLKQPKENQEIFEINTFKCYLQQTKIHYIYICLGEGFNENLINEITDIAEKNYASIGFIPNDFLSSKQNLDVSYLDTFPILTYKKYPLDYSFNQIVKRIFDLIFTFFVFVFILSWVYPIISVFILIYQGRPIHFSQKRNGLNGKEFNCLKFRSMRDDKLNSLKPTERDDPRVTKLGRILRKTSLDELPQFINVLKGEMSIVGPRPHMVSENESYSDIIKRYSLRHYVKPGITGLAQTRGYRGAVDSDKDMEMRIRTDIYYVRNWSFLLDILIIFRTVRLMIFGDENAI